MKNLPFSGNGFKFALEMALIELYSMCKIS